MAPLKRKHNEDTTEEITQTAPKQSNQFTAKRITFFTLPRELRQKILIEALKYHLTKGCWVELVDVLVTTIEEWRLEMRLIHDRLTEDVDYVAELISGR